MIGRLTAGLGQVLDEVGLRPLVVRRAQTDVKTDARAREECVLNGVYCVICSSISLHSSSSSSSSHPPPSFIQFT